MTAVKVEYRLKSPDLAFGESFQANHQARIDRPIDNIDLNTFFMDVQANLKPGDTVTVVAYKDRTWSQVMQVRKCIILSSQQEVAGGKNVTRAAWLDEMFEVPETAVAKPAHAKVQKLSVVKEFGGGFTVQDARGHVIERVKTKAEAEAYIANLSGKPETKAKAA